MASDKRTGTRRSSSGSYESRYADRYSGSYQRSTGTARTGSSRTSRSGSAGTRTSHEQVPSAYDRSARQQRGYTNTAASRSAGVGAYSSRRQAQRTSYEAYDQRGADEYGAYADEQPERRRRRARIELPDRSTVLKVLAVVLAAVIGFAVWSNRSVDISLNGTTTSVKVGSSLATIVSEKRLITTAGNLVSVNGNVIDEGEGYAYSATVNGEDIATEDLEDYRASAGDQIVIGQGADKLEDYDVQIVEEQPKLEMGGDAWGNITYISQWGKVGKREVRYGKTSGETANGDVIQEVQNCVVTVHQITPDDSSRKLVALTFDDGPAETYTEAYLSILDQYGIKATFFNLGENIQSYPDLAKKIVDSGNEIMSHTHAHQQLSTLESDALQEEFRSAFSLIESTTGVKTTAFRPPYGDFKESTWLKSGGLATVSVLWNMDSEDWRRAGADSIVSKSTEGIFSGAIILMHDGGGERSQDVEALPRIIETLQAEGYEFVTVGELMKSDSSIPADIADGSAAMPEDAVWPTEIAS